MRNIRNDRDGRRIHTVDRLRLLIRDALGVDVPSDDTDLIDAGLLDSLGLATILAEIEGQFGLELPLDDLDVSQFRSIDRMAQFLAELDRAAP